MGISNSTVFGAGVFGARFAGLSLKLLLAQLTEALFRAAEIIPVQVRKRKGPRNETVLLISARNEPRRAKLAEALKVDSAERALARLFGDEEGDLDAKWVISESGSVGRPGRDNLAVRFVRTARNDTEWIYEFSGEGELPPASDLFLRKLDDAGTEGAMHRRLRMLGTLATQEELATMLAAPRSRMRTYPDELVEDAAFADLDDSKQSALRSIWTTGPTQFVVGPPGVGKTRLVTEVVRRILQEQPSARILSRSSDVHVYSEESRLLPIPFRETGCRGFWSGGPNVSGHLPPQGFPPRTRSWRNSTSFCGVNWPSGLVRSFSDLIRGGFLVRII